jgi:hypothetical protein
MNRLRHPVRAIREPFGTAGLIVACVALIAALAGGAYAASGGLTAKQKKEVKKIAKQFAGKPGATGATGPAGSPGAKGDTGAAGTNGKDGTNGTDGKNGTNGTNGTPGAKGEAGMCSAEEPECSLAAGGVLTGVWAAAGGEGDLALASISFPVRVSPAPSAVFGAKFSIFQVGFKLEDGQKTLIGPYPCLQAECENPGTGEGALEQAEPEAALLESEAAYKQACPGSATEPEAAAGFLCIYKSGQGGGFSETPTSGDTTLLEAATEFGVTLPYRISAENSYARGSWAVAG